MNCVHNIDMRIPCKQCQQRRPIALPRVEYSSCVHGVTFGHRCDNCLSLTMGIPLEDAKLLKPGADGRFEYVHKGIHTVQDLERAGMEALRRQRNELFEANTRQMQQIEQLQANIRGFEAALMQKISMFDALIEQNKSLLRTSEREDATITAALRLWQQEGSECQYDFEDIDIYKLATMQGKAEPLDNDEIEALIGKLNR